MLELELYEKCPSGAIPKPGKDAIVSKIAVFSCVVVSAKLMRDSPENSSLFSYAVESPGS
jgi:hypothetical protein